MIHRFLDWVRAVEATWFGDMAERAFWTFWQTFLAVLTVDNLVDLEVGDVKVALIAGLAAALSVAKSAIARHVGDPESAAIMPVGPAASKTGQSTTKEETIP